MFYYSDFNNALTFHFKIELRSWLVITHTFNIPYALLFLAYKAVLYRTLCYITGNELVVRSRTFWPCVSDAAPRSALSDYQTQAQNISIYISHTNVYINVLFLNNSSVLTMPTYWWSILSPFKGIFYKKFVDISDELKRLKVYPFTDYSNKIFS